MSPFAENAVIHILGQSHLSPSTVVDNTRYPPLVVSPQDDGTMSLNDLQQQQQQQELVWSPPSLRRVNAFDEWDNNDDDDDDDDDDENDDIVEFWSPPPIRRVLAFDECDDEKETSIEASIDRCRTFNFHDGADNSNLSPLITSIVVLEGEELNNENAESRLNDDITANLQLPLLDHSSGWDGIPHRSSAFSAVNCRIMHEGNRTRLTIRNQGQRKVLFHEDCLKGPLEDQWHLQTRPLVIADDDDDDDDMRMSRAVPPVPEVIFVKKSC